jgi:YbgC/YbaW family acyl-CoA thioester hydrolase
MIFKYIKRIYGFECDVYGHLNNANYLMLYEAARAEALSEMGMNIAYLKDNGVLMFIVNAEISYKKGLKIDEEVLVKSRLVKHDRLYAYWVQEIYNAESILSSVLNLKIVYVNLDSKPTRISTDMFNFFDKYITETIS